MTSHALCLSLAVLALSACSSKGSQGEAKGPMSDGGQAGSSGIDPLRRYEPAERVDFDNVVSYGDGVVTMDLPEPPRSGFRLVVPPRVLKPGDEVEACQAWAYPAIHNHAVYSARVYTTGGLHHSNMYGVPLDPGGASPYPGCGPGQSDIFKQVPNFLTGDIMDVLFANSTQIEGGEEEVFHPGMAFKIKTDGREVATSIHWLSTADTEFTSEIVYDFFTMPDEEVTTEIVPFVFENQNFQVPAQQVGDITTTCDIVGEGNIVSIMPHTHKRATSFNVELLGADGAARQIFHDGNFDTGSEITVFDEPIPLKDATQIRHTCTVNNDLTRPIIWGIGDDEMCTLFGYMYPPSAQLIGYVGKTAASCLGVQIGGFRK